MLSDDLRILHLLDLNSACCKRGQEGERSGTDGNGEPVRISQRFREDPMNKSSNDGWEETAYPALCVAPSHDEKDEVSNAGERSSFQ